MLNLVVLSINSFLTIFLENCKYLEKINKIFEKVKYHPQFI